MSDDRAERIRRIREGRRDAAEGTGTDATEADGADAGEPNATDADGRDEGAAAAEDADAAPAADAGDAVEPVDGPEADRGDSAGGSAVDVDAERPDAESVADGETTAVQSVDAETTDDETMSVLEFVLGDERYCLEIEHVEQIVERGSITRIPNAPAFVEGVIDLRGDITTVIDPKQTLTTGSDGGGDRIVVFDADSMEEEWSVGWTVDGVRRVSTVSLSSVKDSPVDEPWINGVIKRDDDEFVIWTEPGELMRVDEER